MTTSVPGAGNRSKTARLGLAAAVLAALAAIVFGLSVVIARYTAKPTVPMPPLVQRADPAAAAPEAPVASAQVPAACAFEPLVPPQGAADGQFKLEAALADPTPPNSQAFAAVAKEMAAQQRWRDAEVALIAACRAAAPKAGARTVPVANAQSRLAQFYVDYARRVPPGPRDQLRARAQELLSASAATYESVLGKESSRTRMAAKRAAALAQPGPMAPDAVAENPADSDPGDGTAAMGAARITLPRADVDLPQLDDDLERLRAQAGGVTRDPEGFRRRSAQAEARRQACQDQEPCLRQWHAQRRRQLLGEF